MRKALYDNNNNQCTECTHQLDSRLEKKENYGLFCHQCKKEVSVGFVKP